MPNYRNDELYGIVNGTNYEEQDPVTDPYLERNYDSITVAGKADIKPALQRKSGLPPDRQVPLIGMVSRLDEQR